MKIGEALSELKRGEKRLTRLIELRKDNVFIEKGKKSDFDIDKLSEEINNKVEEIRTLKIKIQKTNLTTKIPNEGILLAEAIIKVNDLRAKISNLSRLFEEKRDFLFRDKDKVEKTSQLNQAEIEKEIESLEKEKIDLDNKIQITNWETELKD